MKSMTGFGRAVYETETVRVIVELKSVNNRFLECGIYLPKGYACLEDKVRKQVGQYFSRGKMALNCTIQELVGREKKIMVDETLFLAYHEALDLLSQQQYGKGISLRDVMACSKDWIAVEEEDCDMEAIGEAVLEAVRQACSEMETMRFIEGEHLKSDIKARIHTMQEAVQQVEERAPYVIKAYEERLTERMEELVARFQVESDLGRILQEVAIFADKADITEEIVRLTSHFQQFLTSLESTAPVGRKLDFLVQEINREINTIGSKGNDLIITEYVVKLKNELEKVREQVQNVE